MAFQQSHFSIDNKPPQQAFNQRADCFMTQRVVPGTAAPGLLKISQESQDESFIYYLSIIYIYIYHF